MLCGVCKPCNTFYRWGAVGELEHAYCPHCGQELAPGRASDADRFVYVLFYHGYKLGKGGHVCEKSGVPKFGKNNVLRNAPSGASRVADGDSFGRRRKHDGKRGKSPHR